MAKRPSEVIYETELRYFERALNSPNGIKIGPIDRGHGINLRLRLNKLRAAIREQNRLVYPTGDERYNTTPFDGLTVSIIEIEDEHYVTISPKPAVTITEL